MALRILVLGSQGQIGMPLCDHLQQLGHTVTNYDLSLGPRFDLRRPRNLALERRLAVSDFVYFLAFDVGGAPYLARRDASFEFIQGNDDLMRHTFAALRRWGGPFLFASSQMSQLPQTAYGSLKALGEQYTRALGGTSIRLWNVYGIEPDSTRAHVITDFVRMALQHGVISMRTAGTERRDFMHATDCARGLALVMEQYPLRGPGDPLCLATGHWTTIREIADHVAQLTDARIEPGTAADLFAESNDLPPRLGEVPGWSPRISLADGLRMVVEYWSRSTRYPPVPLTRSGTVPDRVEPDAGVRQGSRDPDRPAPEAQ